MIIQKIKGWWNNRQQKAEPKNFTVEKYVLQSFLSYQIGTSKPLSIGEVVSIYCNSKSLNPKDVLSAYLQYLVRTVSPTVINFESIFSITDELGGGCIERWVMDHLVNGLKLTDPTPRNYTNQIPKLPFYLTSILIRKLAIDPEFDKCIRFIPDNDLYLSVSRAYMAWVHDGSKDEAFLRELMFCFDTLLDVRPNASFRRMIHPDTDRAYRRYLNLQDSEERDTFEKRLVERHGIKRENADGNKNQ